MESSLMKKCLQGGLRDQKREAKSLGSGGGTGVCFGFGYEGRSGFRNNARYLARNGL